MAMWGTPLTVNGGIDATTLRRLQALAITTVEDLRYALLSTPDQIADVVGGDGLEAFRGIWSNDDTDEHLLLAMEAVQAPPALGADPPPGVEVLEEVPEELFLASLAALGPTPQEMPDDDAMVAGA